MASPAGKIQEQKPQPGPDAEKSISPSTTVGCKSSRSGLATTKLMAKVTRLRQYYGLAALAYVGETTPMLLPIGAAHRSMTRGAMHLTIKQVFRALIGALALNGRSARVRSRTVASGVCALATAYDRLSHDGLPVDLRYVRDNFRLESISAASQYLHADDDDRHRATWARPRLKASKMTMLTYPVDCVHELSPLAR